MPIDMTLEGARVLRPDGWDDAPVSVAGGRIAECAAGRWIDLSDSDVLMTRSFPT